MRISETVTVEIKDNGTWEDYSEGILGVSVLRGVLGYEALWETPEAGVLTITTRNPNVDPYVNPAVRMGREIRVKANSNVLFTGRLTDINVDYQPKGDPQITTLIAVDMIGQMSLHALSDGFTEQLGSSMDIFAMFQELNGEIVGWSNPFRESGFLWPGNASGVTASGSTALSVAKILAQTAIQFFYADRNNDVYLYNRINKKQNEESKIQFDSRGGATSYREIELTDNFEVLTNQLSIRNQGYNTNVIPLYTNSYSVGEWGQSKKDFRVQISGLPASQIDITDDIRDAIFADSVHPSREIYSITWDASLEPDLASEIDILDNVFIYHQVDPEDIARKYGVIGIEHEITDDDWQVKYYLKNHFVYDTNFPVPVVTSDHPLGGTINDDITLSISNIDDIETTSATYAWKYAAGTTGNTVGSTFSTAESPVLDYALANVGIKYITCTVTDSYGFVKTSAPYVLEIFGAAPTAVTTSYTINPNDTAIYTFTATTTEATSYTFHWGDGTTYTTTNNLATHRYDTEGTRDVYVVASNAYGSTTSPTTTIDVEFLPFPTAEVGTFPLRYVVISHPAQNMAGPSTITPGFGRLQLNTSNAPAGSPSTDPQVNRSLIGSWEINKNYEPYSTVTGNNQYVVGNPAKINLQSQPEWTDWCYFTMPFSGTFSFSTVFDMGATFYDIKDIRLTFKNLNTTSSIGNTTFNVWITDNIEDVFDFNTSNFWKIGTLSSGTIPANGTVQASIVPLSYISLPLDAEPFPNFTYTVGNSSENITGDKYTFSTDDFLTSAYLWNFGDGNTSTLQNPVHIYTTSGSKTVTLTKYDEYGNPHSSSQTFTVNRVADQIGTFPVRYIKLKQNPFTSSGTTVASQQFSPMIGGLFAKTSATNLDRIFNKNATSYTQLPSSIPIKWMDRRSTDIEVIPTASSPSLGSLNGIAVFPRNSLTVGYSQTSWDASGLYPMRTNIGDSGTTEWEMVFDLTTPRYDIYSIGFRVNRSNLLGQTSTNAKPSYEIYFSSDNINWIKVANATVPSTMSNSGTNGWYSVNINTVSGVNLPLDI
jgi:PKD repeat protein